MSKFICSRYELEYKQSIYFYKSELNFANHNRVKAEIEVPTREENAKEDGVVNESEYPFQKVASNVFKRN